jgi:flagellar FliL protein
MQKILILANLAVAIIGVVVVFYSHNMIKPPPTDQELEEIKLKEKALQDSQIHTVPLKKIVVNLESQSSKLRYLDIEMNIVTFSESEKEIIKNYEYIFKDSAVEISSYLGPDDLDTITGKLIFEKRLKDKVNDKIRQINTEITRPVIKQIYFSNFVVQ